jgi:hypothetical protein
LSFTDFDETSTPIPHVVYSPVESAAFGIRVGRLNYGIGAAWSRIDVVSELRTADFDLVIVRFPAGRFDVPLAIQEAGLIGLPADTLLYYRGQVPTEAPATAVGLRQLSENDSELVADLVGDVFAGYENHYSANPQTRAFSATSAYQDWSHAALGNPSQHVFAATNSVGHAEGICMIELTGGVAEVQLAGIRERSRGRGVYLDLLHALSNWCAAAGVSSIVISTQAWNIAALRAWSRAGYLPELALTTLHVLSSDR